GINDITKDTLENLFVVPFAFQDKRKQLVERFGFLMEKVEELGMTFEIWINGSFVTKKEEPNDIDIAFFFDPSQLATLTPDKINIFNEVRNNSDSKLRYNCDVYFIPNNLQTDRIYWKGLFSFN